MPVERRWVLTVNREVYPCTIGIIVVRAIQKDYATLKPSLVLSPYVGDLNGRLLDQAYPTLVPRVHMRRVAIKLYKDGNLYALLSPLDYMFHPLASGVVYVTFQDFGTPDARGLAHRAARHPVETIREGCPCLATALYICKKKNGEKL